jgi:opacity protein-like surface antigen
MVMRIITAAAVLTVFIAPPAGFAADNFYVDVRAALTGLQDADHNPTALGESLESDTFPGCGLGASLGTFINERLRVDGQIFYQRYVFGEFTRAGVDEGGDGDVDSLAFMANLFYDIGSGGRWTPYVGAGIGWALVRYDVDAFGGPFTDVPFIDDEDGVFAYQLMAGVTLNVRDGIGIAFGYRFFATSDPELTDLSGRRFDTEYMSHNIEVGLRFRF